MGLFGGAKANIDLLARYNYDPAKRDKRNKILSYVLPGALIVVLLLALIGYNLYEGINLDNQISDYEDKIAELEAARTDALALQEKNSSLTADLKILTESKEKASSEASRYDYLDSKLLSDITAACDDKAEVKLMDFSTDGILFTFQTSALNYDDINVIVKNIEELEYFNEVTYTGYSKVSDEAYSFSVICSFEEESEATE